MRTSHLSCSVAWLLALGVAGTAAAQCSPRWISGGETGGPGGIVYALTVWDPDGPGPKPSVLVAGGSFSTVAGLSAGRIVAWDGSSWLALGGGIGNNNVYALAVLPSGELVAGGDFVTAGGAPASRIAKWDGAAWTPLGAGVDNTVYALAVTSTGELIAGGMFLNAGGSPASRVARWTPSTQTWSVFGAGANFTVNALAPLPAGDLVVGGNFTAAGGVSARFIAKWTNATSKWSAMGTSVMNNIVTSLAVLPGGQIVAGGYFTTASGFPANGIARWDGTDWQEMGAGGMNFGVYDLSVTPDGNLLAGGGFTVAGGPGGGVAANRIALWNTATSTWSPIGSGLDGSVNAVAVFHGEPIAGGNFLTSGTDFCPFFGHFGQPVAPTVRDHPADALACANDQRPFSISTSGSTPFTYQWQIETGPDNWADLSLDPIALPCGGSADAAGATTRQAGITIVPCPSVSTYKVRCIVTNACGTATSNPATITMNSNVAPTNPQSITACVGGTAHFTTTPSGIGPYRFYWHRDDVLIDALANPSAASSELVLSNLSTDDAGRFNCLVYNSCSGAWTNYASLDVLGASACCPADLNHDGFVDDLDFQIFAVAYDILDCADTSMPAGCPADLTGDGLVEDSDFSVFVVAYDVLLCP